MIIQNERKRNFSPFKCLFNVSICLYVHVQKGFICNTDYLKEKGEMFNKS
jgi:hypothetical protein